jgi:putative transcriptional regulator
MKKSRPPLFERLKSSLEDIALYAKGEKSLVETQLMIPEPPRSYSAVDVVAVRSKLGLSQASLAGLMHVSIKTIQGWEQGLRTPSGVASRLLQMIEEPDPFLTSLQARSTNRRRAATG